MSKEPDDKEVVLAFLAVQVALTEELKRHSDEKNVQLRTLLNNVLKMENKLIPLVQRLISIEEENTRRLCSFMGKYGAVPGGFGVMQYPTEKVALVDAKWAFSSSTTAKDTDS